MWRMLIHWGYYGEVGLKQRICPLIISVSVLHATGVKFGNSSALVQRINTF